jgi:tetratricopeptide (TPR) repeat protein
LQGLDNGHLSGIVGSVEQMEGNVRDDINQTLCVYCAGDYFFIIRMLTQIYRTQCYNNMAACHLKNSNWEKAIFACEKALSKSENNAKALFRRAQANIHLKNLDKAETDLRKALEIDPKDAGIRTELAKIKQVRKEYEENSKKEWRGFLNK